MVRALAVGIIIGLILGGLSLARHAGGTLAGGAIIGGIVLLLIAAVLLACGIWEIALGRNAPEVGRIAAAS